MYSPETNNLRARPEQVICWVLGEYGTLAPGGAAAAIERLVDVAERNALSEEVRGYLLSALGKLHAAGGVALGEGAAQLLADAFASHSVDLQLRALQMQALLQCAPCSSCRKASEANAGYMTASKLVPVHSCLAIPCSRGMPIGASGAGLDIHALLRKPRRTLQCVWRTLPQVISSPDDVRFAYHPQGPRGDPGGGIAPGRLLRGRGGGPRAALPRRARGVRAGRRRAALHPPARCVRKTPPVHLPRAGRPALRCGLCATIWHASQLKW